MSGKIVQLRKAKKYRNATSRTEGRRRNDAYRVREHLTEAEMDKLLGALKHNRHGHRDWLVGLLIYRHGLRVSEACNLRWDDIDLSKRTIIVRRLKGSTDSVHYLEREEVNGLKLLQRQQQANGIKAAYLFINERGQPFGRMGIGSAAKLLARDEASFSSCSFSSIRAQAFRAANLVELHSAPAALVRSSCARHDTSQPSTRARCPIHSLI